MDINLLKNRNDGSNEVKLLEAYTDGSYSVKVPDKVGWAFVTPTGIQEAGYLSLESHGEKVIKMRQIGGELEAATAAVRYALDNGYSRVTIHHDYTGVCSWVDESWKAKNEHTQAYRDWMQKQKHNIKIHFVHVKAHSDNELNDKADALAKQAIGI